MFIEWTGGASYLLLDLFLTYENGEVVEQITTTAQNGNGSLTWIVPSIQGVRGEKYYILMCYVTPQNVSLDICSYSDSLLFGVYF